MASELRASTSRSASRRRRRAGWRLGVAGLAVAGHAAVLAALIGAGTSPREPFAPQTIPIDLAEVPPPLMRPAPLAAAEAPVAGPPPPQSPFRRAPPSPEARPLPASETTSDEIAPVLSEAQLAGAAAAGSGPAGGRACDMARRLLAALRRDSRVQAAVAEAGRVPGAPVQALFVWNGDWIRSRGQDGAGLAAVREAILWEVAFAPAACRAEPVHGLVLFSMGDAPGAARLVLGADDWRWSDLLRPRPGKP